MGGIEGPSPHASASPISPALGISGACTPSQREKTRGAGIFLTAPTSVLGSGPCSVLHHIPFSPPHPLFPPPSGLQTTDDGDASPLRQLSPHRRAGGRLLQVRAQGRATLSAPCLRGKPHHAHLHIHTYTNSHILIPQSYSQLLRLTQSGALILIHTYAHTLTHTYILTHSHNTHTHALRSLVLPRCS